MAKNLIDLHTHSNFSPDAESSAEEMCKQAIKLGLSAYALTDHCDCNMWYSAEHYFDDISKADDLLMYGAGEYINKSICEQLRLKNKFGEQLNLLIGAELGQPLQDLENAETVAENSNIDFIIGSHHQNAGKSDFYFLDYSKMEKQEIYSLLDDYFNQVYQMCIWGKFDVLGHLTYPLRYICGDFGIEIDMSLYNNIISEIFKKLISNNKGIEINTSGLRQKYGLTFPTIEYVKLFKNLGGEIIAVGSDAHCVKDLGKGISDGIEIAQLAGFEYIAYFEKHKPQFIKI